MSIFSKLFSKKEIGLPADLSILKTDMHSHLIPGIDDGSQSMDETIAMLAKFKELGYKKIVTTPHIMSDYYRNTPEIILDGLAKVREELKRINLDIEIEAAAEYYFDETLFTKLEEESFLTFNNKHVLIEFSFSNEPQGHDKLFYDMRIKGYKPVIAHFERYLFFHGSIEKAQTWRENGMLIQLNINSLFGHYGLAVQKQAEKLIDAGLVDYIATDCHRIEHLAILEKNLTNKYLKKVLEFPLHNQKI
jgi:tyrosine-protein phosphatase YwqE